MANRRMWLGWIGLALLVGGCARPETTGTLSPEQLIERLNARTAQVPRLKARGRISMEWKDREGNHRQTADAVLYLQRYDQARPGGAPAADVALLGSFGGNEVFLIGVNATHHWMAFPADSKKAYVGRVGVPRTKPDEGAPFRADRVLEVLGLIPLAPGPLVTVTPREDRPSDEVAIYQAQPGGGRWLQRVEVVDRKTGDIQEVRLYFPSGKLEARATLGDYHVYKGAQEGVPEGEVRLPYQIRLAYPDQQAQVDLVLMAIRVNPEIAGEVFALPDFAGQGLEVEAE